jgi:hypothetical protein
VPRYKGLVGTLDKRRGEGLLRRNLKLAPVYKYPLSVKGVISNLLLSLSVNGEPTRPTGNSFKAGVIRSVYLNTLVLK